MPEYRVFVTRFDDPHIIEEIHTARGLSFSMPVNEHGECTFSAFVPGGRPGWRPALALPFSGVLVARDGVPVWDGVVISEQQSGPRTFSFTAREWGWFFEEKVPATPRSWVGVNDHVIFRDLVNDAQAISGQNVMVQTGSTLGGQVSDRTVTVWDKATAGAVFREVADAAGGPEWYFGVAGTLDEPVRQLIQDDRLGHTTPEAVLEYVEDTEPLEQLAATPRVALLGDLFPGPAPLVPTRRAGGNVIAQSRSRSLALAATQAQGFGSGPENAQIRRTEQASKLLAAGWPRMTLIEDYSDVSKQSTLNRKTKAALARHAGIPTGYSLVNFDDDPMADWTQTPRGSSVQVVLDTDVYGADRPVGGANGFAARSTGVTVRVPDDGRAQVEWSVADVLEVQ